MKTCLILKFALLATLLIACFFGDAFAEEQAQSSPEEIRLLEEIVKVREAALQRQEQLYEVDRASDISQAKLSLLRARIELTKKKGDLESAITHLEDVLAIRQNFVKSHELEAELGKGDSGEAAEAKVKLLKARLELVRLQNALTEKRKK